MFEKTIVHIFSICTGCVKIKLKLQILFRMKNAAHVRVHLNARVAVAGADQMHIPIPHLFVIKTFKCGQN